MKADEHIKRRIRILRGFSVGIEVGEHRRWTAIHPIIFARGWVKEGNDATRTPSPIGGPKDFDAPE